MEKNYKNLIESGWKVALSYWEFEMRYCVLIKDSHCIVFNESSDKPITSPTRICTTNKEEKIIFFHHENEGIANNL